MDARKSWFHEAVIYQIYPRSFLDTTGDGTGDLKGITKKLSYINGDDDSLGIQAVWLSPFYTSPMADFGYDVSNHCNVDKRFGTLDDFKELLSEAHRNNIKVLIDFIPNHTSDEHPWFKESRLNLHNPKRSWYIWRDPKPDGSPPSNWIGVFGGPAWELDPLTNQYYLHSFIAKQPDLNWANPEVRQAMHDILNFWLYIGVDGFRVDAVNWLSKDTLMRDNPLNPYFKPGLDLPYEAQYQVYSKDGPELFHYLKGIASVVGSYPHRFMITEAIIDAWTDASSYLPFYEKVNPEVCAPFNFASIHTPWQAKAFRKLVDDFQEELGEDYVAIYTLGNHDQPRLASRIGLEAARVAAMMQLTLPGMPIIYYGEELGMIDGEIKPNQIKDPKEFNNPGQGLGRDPERTPMQWNEGSHAGFTKGSPWLPVNPNHKTVNVELETKDPHSHLNLYKKLLMLRQSFPALRDGSYKSFDSHPNIFSYIRENDDQKFCVLLNFSHQAVELKLEFNSLAVIETTYLDANSTVENGLVYLRPNEGLLLEIL